eukprot:144711-Prymnesium_polylepis.1
MLHTGSSAHSATAASKGPCSFSRCHRVFACILCWASMKKRRLPPTAESSCFFDSDSSGRS